MGYNSVVLVMNDYLHQIKNDARFGYKIWDAISSFNYPPAYQPYISGVQVAAVHHADSTSLVATGANRSRLLGYGHWRDNDEQLLVEVLQNIRNKSK